jgi:hypothetical protein
VLELVEIVRQCSTEFELQLHSASRVNDTKEMDPDKAFLSIGHLRFPRLINLLLAILTVACSVHGQARNPNRRPIMLDRSGGFTIGGKVLVNPNGSNTTLSCDHGYVEYFIPYTPRATSLIMWHSSSTQTFQNRWDGGEGYKDIFLRRDYPVYFWEGPWVGRAGWPCQPFNVRTRSYHSLVNLKCLLKTSIRSGGIVTGRVFTDIESSIIGLVYPRLQRSGQLHSLESWLATDAMVARRPISGRK